MISKKERSGIPLQKQEPINWKLVTDIGDVFYWHDQFKSIILSAWLSMELLLV
jgi:hypothetical protein